MANVNTLDFEMFDPVKAGEPWANEWGSENNVVEIIIDGKKLIDIISEIEIPYAAEEGHPDLAGAYGHIPPSDLYADLIDATTDEFLVNYGVYLFCCDDCGEPGCWSVRLKVKEEESFIYWYGFEHEHRKGWNYNLNYRFKKSAYEQALQKLKNMAEEQTKKTKKGKKSCKK